MEGLGTAASSGRLEEGTLSFALIRCTPFPSSPWHFYCLMIAAAVVLYLGFILYNILERALLVSDYCWCATSSCFFGNNTVPWCPDSLLPYCMDGESFSYSIIMLFQISTVQKTDQFMKNQYLNTTLQVLSCSYSVKWESHNNWLESKLTWKC